MSTATKAWLDAKHAEWGSRQPRKDRTVKAFARYVGVSLSSMNNWLNRGQTPDAENAARLAEKLGYEIYDILGIPRPDPFLTTIINLWGSLTDEIRAEVVETVTRAGARDRTKQSDRGVEPSNSE